MTLYAAAVLVTGETVHAPGWFETGGGRVTAVGGGAPPRPADTDLGDAVVVPGFVDLHCHGGGGFHYDSPDPEHVLAAAAFHRSRGTTTAIAGLVTAEPAALRDQLALLRELVDDGAIAGVFLEGPWLSPEHPGAHPVPLLREPDPAEVADVLRSGIVRLVTLATEREHGLDAVRAVVDAGAVAALGHTDADAVQARAAVDAGVTVATHLFNAMRPLHHRVPGPVAALLDDDRVTVELIADGVHVHPLTAELVLRAAGPGRVALVTDASAAAGMPDGGYRLGRLDITVQDGVARLTGGTSIASSVVGMDALFRAGYAAALERGTGREPALLAASVSTSVTPARAVDLTEVGVLAPGRRAHAVVLDPETLEPRQTLS